MFDLDEIRKNIDATDKEIIKLLERRIGLAREVAAHKKDTGKKVFDAVREQQKLASVETLVEDAENASDIRKIFEQIMLDSRKIQYRELERNGMSMLDPYEEYEDIPRTGVQVAYQGVPGAYAHIAARRFFKGNDASNEHFLPSWRDVMERVVAGDVDFGVLPIENSTAGSVTQVYDLLNEYPVYIVAEECLEIEHALLVKPGTGPDDIRKVFSHAQAFFQCREFLEKYPAWEKISTENTAASAKMVSECGDDSCAAIAGVEAGEMYGLEVLRERINDLQGNTTRFIIVSASRRFLKDAKKVSVVFETPNERGTLYNLLSSIVYNDLNMTKIESRPLRSKKWDSRFFVDFEGNLSDPAVKNALTGMYEEAKSMRLLGNY